eukprot:TRINITY_DN1631_c0_g1_i3.p1 TRINITY_DN1631_c0_g1~~TRINITY_DN1631_c0_g1_i3.p1  ORF type:complete len:2306 (+),score=986.21 TRINITY_DN1631_c0_g1_i3:123-7040(+)
MSVRRSQKRKNLTDESSDNGDEGGSQLLKRQSTGIVPTTQPTSFFQIFQDCGLSENDSRKYEKIFEENEIELDLIPMLTYQLLNQMSVKLGHQMKIMRMVNTKFQSRMRGRYMAIEDGMEEDSFGQLPIEAPSQKSSASPAKGKGKGKGIDTDEIRRKIRGAFVKDPKQAVILPTFGSTGKSLYFVDMDTMRVEIKRGTDYELVSQQTQNALTVLEAITDEVVAFGTDAGENNIRGYPDLLTEIAKAWVDVLLSRNVKLDKPAREIWETKLTVWDKSPDPENGTFTNARWAVKHGWHDTQLKNVLKGDFIGKFYEPTGLVIARLNILEREEKFQEAVSLAQSVDLFFYAAKFLIKLGKVKEAETVGLKLKDPANAFTIAQIARPLDYKISFNLAIHSVVLTTDADNQNNAGGMERATWLCELAVSQKILPEFISLCTERIRNKIMLFELCKLLRKMDQLPSALELAKICLKPYTPEQIQQYKDDKDRLKGIEPKPKIPGFVEEVDPTFLVPRDLALWLWNLVYYMKIATIIQNDVMLATLDLILDLAEDVEQLLSIAQDMRIKTEYDLIMKVGRRCLELCDKLAKQDYEKKKLFLTQQHEVRLLREEEQQLLLQRKQLSPEKLARLVQLDSAILAANLNPQFDPAIDNTRLRVTKLMTSSAMESKLSFLPEKVMKREAINEVVQLCVNSTQNNTHLISLAEDMKNANENDYSLQMAEAALERIKELTGQFFARLKIQDKLNNLRNEQAELQAQRKQLDKEKLDELNDLVLKESLFQITPLAGMFIHDVSQFDNMKIGAAKLMVTVALNIKAQQNMESLKQSKPSDEQAEAEVWKVVERCLTFISSPNHMMQIGALLKDRDCYKLVQQLGKKAAEKINQMKKRFAERQKPIQTLRLLQDEQSWLLQIKKQLTQEQQDEMQRLEVEVKNLPKLPGYDPANADQYEKLALQVAQQIVNSLFDSKAKMEAKIARDLQMTEAEIESERKQKRGEVQEALTYCLQPELVWDPRDMVTLAQDMNNQKENVLVMQVADKVMHRIKELNNAAEQREPFVKELEQLRGDREKLRYQKKALSHDMQDKYLECELQDRIDRQGPSYQFLTPYQSDNLLLQLSQLVLKATLDSKDELENKIDNDIEKKMSQAQIAADRKVIAEQLDSVLNLCLTNVVDPQHLNQLANTVASRYRKEIPVVVKLTEASHVKAEEVDKQREVRAPIQRQLDECNSEIQALELVKKSIPSDLDKRVKSLEKSLAKLPKWPHYAGDVFDPNYYSSLYQQNANLNISTVVKARQQYEQKIQQQLQVNEKQVAEERATFDVQLRQAVDFCLDRVEDPTILAASQSDLGNNELEINLNIDLGKKAQDRIKYLEDLRSKRAPLQAQIDKLKAEQASLQEKKKTLHPQQQQTLDKLEAALRALPRLPPYAKLFQYNQYQHLNLSIAQKITSSVLYARDMLEAKVRQLMEEDTYVMQEDKIKQERAVIDAQTEKVVSQHVAELRNPEHIITEIHQLSGLEDTKHVHRLGVQALTVIKTLDDQRAVRAPLQKKLNELREEEEQMVDQKKTLSSQQQKDISDLEEKLKNLPDWPYFASLFNYHEYDQNKLDVVTTLMDVYTNKQNALEEKIKAQMFNDPSSVNQADVEKQRKELQTQMDKVVTLSLSHVSDPNFLFRFATHFAYREQPESQVRVVAKIFEQVAALERQREERDRINELISLLQNEQQQLEAQKKQLAPAQIKQLENLTEEIKNRRFPYVTNANQHDNLILGVATLLFASVSDFKTKTEQKILAGEEDRSLSVEQVDTLKKRVQTNLDDAVNLILSKLENPNSVLALLQNSAQLQDYERVVAFGRKALALVQHLEVARKAREGPKKELVKLREEKEILEQNRKQLSPQQQNQLRDLELEQRLLYLRPSYVCSDEGTYDDLSAEVANAMINALIEKRVAFENKAAMNDALSADEIETEKHKLKQELETAVKECLRIIRNVNNLQSVIDTLNDSKEYSLVIKAGQRAEERIEELRRELEKREQLNLQKENIESEVMLQKDGATEDQKKMLQQIEQQLQELPVEYEDAATLDNYTLDVAGKIIAAAKIEDLDDVLRVQTSLAFKVDTTPDRWNQVKMLTSETEWEEVKKDLVKYLLKASSNPEDKNYIDPGVKVDLLLKEGLWKECLAIFPKPSNNDHELELLFKLWIEVEKFSPNDLKDLLPTVERYVKNYFQGFRYTELDKLLDQIQKKFPNNILDMFKNGTEVMLINLLPSQYGSFVQFFRAFKKRMVALNQTAQWEEFFKKFKVDHKGKKKLMGMLNMLGDSSWNIPLKK